MSIPTQDQMDEAVSQATSGMTREDMEQQILQGSSERAGMQTEEIQDYISSMSDEELSDMFAQLAEQFRAQFAA